MTSGAANIVVLVNGSEHPLPEGTTVEKLVDQLGVVSRHVAVELNRQVVPRGEHPTRQLHQGDELEIVTLVGGG